MKNMLVPICPNCPLMNGAVPFNNSHLQMSIHEWVCFYSSTGFLLKFLFIIYATCPQSRIDLSSSLLLASPH